MHYLTWIFFKQKMSNKTVNHHELNLRVILIGIALSIIMGSANVYLGLKAGMTVSASIPAAVIGMITLRYVSFFFKHSEKDFILEANQIQTAASAGESLAAGIIFTMPALILIGVWEEFDIILTTVIAFTGGLLGILFMIPMRQVFIVSNESNLKYPEGVACASVLEAGKDKGDPKQATNIFKGILIGALFKVLISFVGLLKGVLEFASIVGNKIIFFGGDISPALVAVGFIVRLNVAILIFIGGAISWLIGIPIIGNGLDFASNPLNGAWEIWSSKIRYIGVGAMVIGGIASIFKVRKGLVDAMNILRQKDSTKSYHNIKMNERNISPKSINLLSLIAILLVGGVYYYITQNAVIAIFTTAIMIIMAFFFTAVASYIVGLVGNSNSPVSGMTITAVLFTGGLLYVFGFSGTEGMVATLGVAAIVCCAACTSGDVCNDLKTGQIVGASPFRQQIMQIIGVGVASLVMAPIMQLLHENTPGGIGGRELAAPQAGLFASLADGFFGTGHLPWDMVGIGALIGVIILLGDAILESNRMSFRLHLMPIAVGMYLPFGLSTPILLGGLIAHFIGKQNKNTVHSEASLQNGILISSGLIAGESLMGIVLAFVAGVGINSLRLNYDGNISNIITAISAVVFLIWFYKLSKPRKA
ncbi:MAG: oligopeptide transporter, OPT family [Candidatus Marinimicrobia bacterium]|nr:oligopeptide transporter, OPT family [Candidatus Neomarinimicrobiota bacterium]